VHVLAVALNVPPCAMHILAELIFTPPPPPPAPLAQPDPRTASTSIGARPTSDLIVRIVNPPQVLGGSRMPVDYRPAWSTCAVDLKESFVPSTPSAAHHRDARREFRHLSLCFAGRRHTGTRPPRMLAARFRPEQRYFAQSGHEGRRCLHVRGSGHCSCRAKALDNNCGRRRWYRTSYFVTRGRASYGPVDCAPMGAAMKNVFAALLFLAIFPLTAVVPALVPAARAQNLDEIFSKVKATVVVVRGKGHDVGVSGITHFKETGSGVLISESGSVMTAAHVVNGMDQS